MKLTVLAVVILALGIVLGVALKSTVTEAAPKFATTQFVDASIEAFNQTVVQPIAAAVAQLEGDLVQLDERVTSLETVAPPAREAEISLFAGGIGIRPDGDYGNNGGFPPTVVVIDPSRYPDGTAFRLSVAGELDRVGTFCSRLMVREPATLTFAPIPSSEVCHTGVATNEIFAVESDAFTLPSGNRIYSFDVKATGEEDAFGFNAFVSRFSVRVLAR